jgi:hypothetical protein
MSSNIKEAEFQYFKIIVQLMRNQQDKGEQDELMKNLPPD